MTEPVKNMPEEMRAAFTLNGRIEVESWYFNDTYASDTPRFYSQKEIADYREMVQAQKVSYYRKTDRWLYQALQRFPVAGYEVAIIGSTIPWYESVCLAYGGKPTTIEYNPIVTDQPGLTILTVENYQRAPRQFDMVFSISSFEHDGLGRYGDPLNPDGDLESMEKMKRVVKPGGLLYLAVPVGKDKVVWNAHRIYGRVRLPLLLKNWRVLRKFGYNFFKVGRDTGTSGSYQPVWVLKNV
jgi:SAM-dependent methyltransferase